MRLSTSRVYTLFATVLLLAPLAAGAVTLVNGNFSDAQDFAGWQPTGDVLREPGGAFGQLETDGTFQRTLQQGFLPFVGGAAYTGRITLDLPDLVLGQDATLFFDLFDYPDGSSTIAAIDNVTLEPFADLPLPTTVALRLSRT